MFVIKNMLCHSYVMMHSAHNGHCHTPETVNVKLARKYTKKEASQIIARLNTNLEFKKYSLEKVRPS